ncbi:alpha/beta hydrolase [Granulicella mallensis]|uniref:Pimeloyl-ACP methyl ester carboxylesterase n=1 Tax=Granulicella mallensis TaxID=940614 RepID=A0A7W8EAT0_9BACT|nr:alpha/beta hydrolase [Granulicella mallensis]MBB5063815.1 pimeloyl-ACP methyl ester carboxylesterase [Granulicella mallensis]
MKFAKNATVVLVHGAWADGSSWGTVINGVAEQGLGVICAPLPLTTLNDDIAAVRRVVARIEGPVLLVAHAYAGAVIAGVDDPKVKGLVYITALAPDEGETTVEVFTRTAPHPDAPQMAPDENGFIWMPHIAIGKAFAQNASDEEKVRLEATQRPINVACILEKVAPPSWKTKPVWFLIAKEDRMILEETQRFMAERMRATIKTIPADHIPSLTMPKPVIDLVVEAATSTLAE